MINICPQGMFLPVGAQGFFLGPLLFIIYINDLSDDLQCNPKLFADDTTSFSTVHDINKASDDLNNDLTKIKK